MSSKTAKMCVLFNVVIHNFTHQIQKQATYTVPVHKNTLFKKKEKTKKRYPLLNLMPSKTAKMCVF